MTPSELLATVLVTGLVVGSVWLAQSPGLAAAVVVVLLLTTVGWLGFTAWLRWRSICLRESLRQRLVASSTGVSSLEDGPGLSDGEEQFREHVARVRSQWERTGRV